MKLIAATLAALCAGSSFAAPEPAPLSMSHLGWNEHLSPGAEPRRVETFMMELGDTRLEDWKLGHRDPKMMPFILDCAQYAPADDGSGTWMLHQFRMPKIDGTPNDDSQAFLDFLKRRDVRAALDDVYARQDFGKPGDFLYRRMGLRPEELPAPFNRLSAEALAPVMTIFQYNVGGAIHIKLKPPFDQDGKAQAIFERLRAEISLK